MKSSSAKTIKVIQEHSDQLEVLINGLGMVTLKVTDEGLIIDAWDLLGGKCIGTLALEEFDFKENYIDSLKKEILVYDESQDIDYLFLEQSAENNLPLSVAIANYFSDNIFNIETLTPIKGECSDFNSQVRDLQRPYLKISEEQYNLLYKESADFYKTSGGKIVTFGSADQGYALMPLNEDASKKILDQQ